MPPLQAPIKVSLDVTSRCLLHCQHCRVGKTDSQDVLTFAEIRRIVEDLAQMKVFRIAFSGGEPFLRDDIVEVIRHTLGVSPGRVFVSTSGLRLTDQILSTLHPLRQRLTLKISLDGPPPIHDAIRGRKGAFVAAKEAIEECVRAGFDVQVTTTMMHANVGYLEDILDIVHSTHCSRHYLVELIPVGRATPDMTLTRSERINVQQMIARARKKFGREDYHIVARIPFVGEMHGLMCCAGISECGILADGSVVGCRLLPQWTAGNVRERPFSTLWATPDAFSEFRHMTAKDFEGCAVCHTVALCRGGCRAYAFGMTGSFYAPDSRCPIACPEGKQDIDSALQQDDAVHHTHQCQSDIERSEGACYQYHE